MVRKPSVLGWPGTADVVRALAGFAIFSGICMWACLLVAPPAPVAPGLDQSWRVAISDAGPHGLLFGRDIWFTYGPLGWLAQGTPMTARSITTLTFQSGVILALMWGMLQLVRKASWRIRIIAYASIFVATTMNPAIDYLLLFTAVVIFGTRWFRIASFWPLLGACYGVAAGIGALTKLTSGVDIILATIVFFAVEALTSTTTRRRQASAALAVTIAAFICTLLVAFDGSPTNVIAFLRASLDIALGYSEAMSIDGPIVMPVLAIAELIAYAAVAIMLLRYKRYALAAALAVVALLSWKHGFVRQDTHVVVFFATIAVCFVIVAVAIDRQRLWWVGVSTALAGAAIAFSVCVYFGIPSFSPSFGKAHLQQVVAYLEQPVEFDGQTALQSNANLQADRFTIPIERAIGNRTLDVEPFETAAIDANEERWRPQPTLQAYVAFTPASDDADRQLLVANGPERMLLSFISIDGRYPLTDEPATQIELACRYRTDITADGAPNMMTLAATQAFLLDRRDAKGMCSSHGIGATANVALGQRIWVPQPAVGSAGKDFIVAYIDIRPTILGQIVKLLFRSPEIDIVFYRKDGTSQRWRMIPATARDGIIVNPAPLTSADDADFFRSALLPNTRAFSVETAQPGLYALRDVRFALVERHAR